MDARQRADLDNYITGHYGEDQFQGEDLPDTAHADYITVTGTAYIYEYDPADDGPECEIITRILASHPEMWA